MKGLCLGQRLLGSCFVPCSGTGMHGSLIRRRRLLGTQRNKVGARPANLNFMCCRLFHLNGPGRIAAKLFPQQRKLMGSSAQISTGVRRCGSQEQVPEEGSGRFRRVPACAGVGSGARFRKVPDGSGICWRRFRR